jgi:deoxyribodipyrimidine photo-lyase
MTTIICWLRRELRLTDNTALYNAYRDADTVIPVYILDPVLLNSERLAGPRIAWLFDGLRVFDHDLQSIGSRLLVREGKPEVVLTALAKETNASAVYFARDYSPYATARDARVEVNLRDQGIAVQVFKDLVIHEAREVLTGAKQPFSVYSPFRRVWDTLPKPELFPAPTRINTPTQIESLSIPHRSDALVEPIALPGESQALVRLAQFTQNAIYDYNDTRDIPGVDGTAILSPYLRWGMISVRTCYQAARMAESKADSAAEREGISRWIGELVWREFYYQVLTTHPHVTRGAYRPEYDNVSWENDSVHIDAWKKGQTGYPIVDAAMRQLNSTGWMHNRTRMIVASFLCKDLLVDWRIGERYFMQRLLDGDLASNNGGWQWTAGTGTDAAPYFRVFNPTSQGEKFDPDGVYIRHWLPELRKVPDKFIHRPSQLSHADQVYLDCVIGRDYPAPTIDHAIQRDKVLVAYGAIKKA